MSQMELLVAADVGGVKKNIRFMFPTRPTLKELSAQVELAFQKEAVESRSGVPARFKVAKFQVFVDQLQMWADVTRQGQLDHGKQYFAFQAEKKEKRSVSSGRRTPLRTNNQTPKMKSIEKKIRSNTPERRQTCVSSRQNHFTDKRGRITRIAQAKRTAENDRRFSVFQILTSDAPDVQFLDTKLNHSTVLSLLSQRGVLDEEIRLIQYFLMSMEVGPDGQSSYAQFVRYCKRNVEDAEKLFDIVLSSKPVCIAPTAGMSPSGSVYSPISLSPTLQEDRSSLEPPVLRAAPEPVDDEWLSQRLLQLELEHQQKITEAKQMYAMMSQNGSTRALSADHDQCSFQSMNPPEHQSLSYSGYQQDHVVPHSPTSLRDESDIGDVYNRLATALHNHPPVQQVQYP